MNIRDIATWTLRAPRLVRFGMVGTGGYLVDNTVLFTMIHGAGTGPYLGRAISFAFGVTFTWWGNRNLTFRDRRAHGMRGAAREWFQFVLANIVGGLVNVGLYATLVKFAPPPFNNPFLALPVGVLAALAFNFTLAKRLVFGVKSSP